MLEMAVVGMDSNALLWYQWEHRRRPIHRWEELKSRYWGDFGRPLQGHSTGNGWGLGKRARYEEYMRAFIELATPLKDVPEHIALGTFLNGPREDVRIELIVQNPRDVDHAMDLAMWVEDRRIKFTIG